MTDDVQLAIKIPTLCQFPDGLSLGFHTRHYWQ